MERSMLLPLYDSSSSVVRLLEGAGLAEEVETAAEPALSTKGVGHSGNSGRGWFGGAGLAADLVVSL